MKVLFIWRGPSPYRVDFFNELGKGCDLTVLFERRPQTLRDKKIAWFNESFTNFKGIYLKGILLFGKLWFSYNIFKHLASFRKYDVIVIGMYSTLAQIIALIYLKIFNIPYILNSDGGFIKKDSYIVNKLKYLFIKGAKAYLSSSKGTSLYLQHYGAKENINVYPFSSYYKTQISKNISSAIKAHHKKMLGIEEEVMIMYSGQFIYRKGIDILLRGCSQLSNNCGIYLIGGKPTEQYLKIKNDLNLQRVHFIDFKVQEELSSYYLASDIFVLPTREDIWGLVINEAMAYGLPIVTTDNCLAGTELIEDFINGFIVPTGNSKELAAHVNILIHDNKLREIMSKNNKLKIKDYTIENMAKNHLSFFNKFQNQF